MPREKKTASKNGDNPAKTNKNQELIDALRQIGATGWNGFEGLIAKLLEALTGQHFHLAQSGTQLGRDMSASSPNSNVMAVECKRYRSNTDLDERELLGELVQVVEAIPDLDLWILVTSRDIPSQLNEALRRTAHRFSITYLSISTDDGTPSSLEVLCANAIDLVIEYVGTQATKSSIQHSLEEIATSAKFNERVERLKQEFLSPIIGYDDWRVKLNNWFLQCLQSEKESRARFGQPINVEDDSVKLIKREEAGTRLDEWFNQWKTEPYPFVILGEEGDGKTWSVASWLSNKIKNNGEFPPVLFLSSTNLNDNEPEALFSGVLSQLQCLPALEQEQWKKWIDRWTKRETSDAPIFLLVLDGINERRNHQWWRTLLEKLAGQPWFNQVAVLITCRLAYWQRYIEPLRHIQAVTYTLSPYSDSELGEALAHHNLRRSDIRENLLPLIRKPRYFDLMVQHRERIAETGDVTVARLIYEDWRDRLQRKRDMPLDDDSFQSFVCELARKYQEGSKYIKEQDIGNVLALLPDKQAIFEELQTGGILQSKRGSYQVNEQFLVYGFGLLLVDELQEASEYQDKDLTDVLAQWFEPHSEIDIKAAICGFAALHALSLRDYPKEAKLALLQTWVNSRNPEKTAESDFIAYLPLDPQCYIELAEIVWSEASQNAWVQELLMQSFLRWSEAPDVGSKLRFAFEYWLGFVNIYGYSWQRGTSGERVENVRQEISNRIGSQLQAGQKIEFGNYLITAIEDDGLMRLGRVALAVISHLPRGSFVHAIAIGCVAEAIMGVPSKYELFAWLFRTTPESVWVEVQAEVNCLVALEYRFTQQAAYRLLSFEGSQEAYQLQQTLPQNLFPINPLVEEHRQDPCSSGFRWTQSDCETCLHREDLSPQWIARQIKEHCINPNLSVPDGLGQRLEPLIETISIQKVRTSFGHDRDDHALDDYEPALCAYAPNAIAALVQRITRQVDEREDLALRQLSLTLKEYALIFHKEDQDSIYRAWTCLLDKAASWSEAEELAEMFLFRLVLKTQDAEEQLLHVLQRPEEAKDLIASEHSFLPINNWDVVCNNLTSSSTTRRLQRILWFISLHPQNLPKDILYEQVLPLLDYEDSLVRASILRILYFLEDAEAINVVVNRAWTWNRQNELENHWGSLLLCKYATSLPYSELRCRVHPIYLGYAVQCRGMDKGEVSQYAEDIQHIWSRLDTQIPGLPLDCPSISVAASISGDEDLVMIHWISLSENTLSRSVTFLSQDASWGGIDKGEPQDLNEMMLPNYEQRYQMQSQIMREIIEQQVNAGNIWFTKRFFPHALDRVASERPEIVEQWLETVFADNPKGIRHLHLASSFYETLCAVLLQSTPDKGIRLYWRFQEVDLRIHIKDKYSEIELLDYAFFQAPSVECAKRAWKEKLEQCKTDRELLDIALLAQYGNGRDWLWSNIRQGIQSPAALEKSRAITLLAFVQEPEAFELLSSLVTDQPNTWIKGLLEMSRQRWQTNSWAMHWFRRFLDADDDVTSWASFRLFLHCVDSHFWHWRQQIEAEMSSRTFIEKRREFMEDNFDVIKNRIRNNEKPLEKQYLGHKILQEQVWPWM